MPLEPSQGVSTTLQASVLCVAAKLRATGTDRSIDARIERIRINRYDRRTILISIY